MGTMGRSEFERQNRDLRRRRLSDAAPPRCQHRRSGRFQHLRPGFWNFPDAAGQSAGSRIAWAYFRSRDVSYIVVEPGVGGVRPYLLEIGDPRFRNQFEPVYTDATTSPPTVIFKVVETK